MSKPEASYRALVQQYLKNGKLSEDARDALEIDRMTLRLLPDQATAIEQEVMLPASQVAPVPTPVPTEPIAVSARDPAPDRDPDLSSPESQGSTDKPQPPQPGLRFEPPVPPTLIAPRSADYQSNRARYKRMMRQAYEAEGMLTSEVRADLTKFAQELGLEPSDEAAIEDELSEEFAHGIVGSAAAPAAETLTITASEKSDPAYEDSLKENFDRLEQNLKGGRYQAADKITSEILLAVIRPAQDLDAVALDSFSATESDRAAVQAIDRCWSQNSAQKFGFSRQLAIYGRVSEDGLEQDRAESLEKARQFSQTVDWWIEPLKFYKFYFQLDFTAAAAGGHLPADWFWQLSRPKAFGLGNLGLLAERGGCRIDAYTLPAFMNMLYRCGVKPAK